MRAMTSATATVGQCLRGGRLACLGLGIVLFLVLATAPARALAACSSSCIWSGTTANGGGSTEWSTATNWSGDDGPVAGVNGTVTCPANYCDTDNDLSGASFGGLSIDDTSGYELTGNAITLGSGGLVTTSSGTNTFGVMWTPITLAANQTWMMNGEGTLNIEGAVSGVSSSLEVDQGGASALQFDADDEVGPFTAIGGSVYLDGASPTASRSRCRRHYSSPTIRRSAH
jgi:hypothetical protein